LAISNAVNPVMLKKTLITLVIGVFLCLIKNVEASCDYSGPLEDIVIRSVIDGDTLLLNDGRKIRLLGINTPEMGFGGEENQPYAAAAKAYVESLWQAKRRAKIAVGHQGKDRYGRVLAHMFFDEENVVEHLLAKGWGFSNARPPDLELSDCYADIAAKAQQTNLAVWSNSAFYSDSQSDLSKGFTVLSGNLVEVNVSGHSWWLRLDGNAVLLIDKASQAYFSRLDLHAMLGKK
jgi:endonuclease YncB( thermonuclease family)